MGIATLIGDDFQFPPHEHATEDGVLAIGGRLTPRSLRRAYGQGVFPWPVDAALPVLWFSPPERYIIELDKLHVSRSLRRVVRSGRFDIRFDTAFERVIRACAVIARPRQEGTWIDERMVHAYVDLNREPIQDGIVTHSIEAWEDDRLVGGLYGVAIGGVFSGESMFSLESNASKCALVALVEHMRSSGMAFLDCQVHTDHLESMGGRYMERDVFLERLAEARRQPAWQHP